MGALDEPEKLPLEKKQLIAGYRWLENDSVWISKREMVIVSLEYLETHAVGEFHRDLATARIHADGRWVPMYTDSRGIDVAGIVKRAGY